MFECAFGLEGGGGGTSEYDVILSQPPPLLPGKALIPVEMLLVLIAAVDKTT